jgi:NAD(P)-dependent dehydrogenase (short-subunit alcohol dehydrogenase family)
MDPAARILAGKVALVTGGTRGIGAMIARGLAAAGARVYITARDPERGARTAREIAQAEGWCESIPADLGVDSSVAAVTAAVCEREAALHVLVNNAADHWVERLEQHTGPRWDSMWALNVKAPFHLVVGLLDRLQAAAQPGDPARVINIGSADGMRVPALESYAYGASKAALHHLTRHLARRLARRGITVNCIAPGVFDTDMFATARAAFGERAVETVPMKRTGTPEEVAGTAVYLASRASAYVTGAILPLDGGLSL